MSSLLGSTMESNLPPTGSYLMSTSSVPTTTGDIWSTGAFSFESPLKDLLDSGNFALEQLLAEDELLQELRGVHQQLIRYFGTEEAVTKLVQYIILPPPSNTTTPTHTDVVASSSPPESDPSHSVKNGLTEEGAQQLHNHAMVLEGSTAQDPGHWLKNQQQGASPAAGPHKDNATKANKDLPDAELRHVRFPYMACEIFSCEIPQIIDVLVYGYVPASVNSDGKEAADAQAATATSTTTSTSEAVNAPMDELSEIENTPQQQEPPRQRILDLLFSVLYESKAGELDDYRAGYLDKILVVLFRKRPEGMVAYMNRGGGGNKGDVSDREGRMALMKAMFQHLYSHSIMQIAQRLLLPARPTPPRPAAAQEGGIMDPNQNGGAEILPAADEAEVVVRCDWSDSPEAVDLLLDCLVGPDDTPTSPLEMEHKLDQSLNASEVLITIIQNSMLSSETMLKLTSSETLHRLVRAATTLRGNDTYFSPHESLLTSAMNVLESIILQLGGYGAVGTMSLLPEQTDSTEAPKSEEDALASAAAGDENSPASPLISDLTSLLEHLPNLLASFSHLLRHPSTKSWLSPMQFSRSQPIQLLGNSRLRIVRVLESLVLLGDADIDSRLVASDCMEICLDLFWEFQWCSMLHQSVANLLVHVFEGQNTRVEMQEYFLVKCNLLGRLMNSFLEIRNEVVEGSNDNAGGKMGISLTHVEERDASTGGMHAPAQSFRYGYMGHVIIICQALVHACTTEMNTGDTPSESDVEKGSDNGRNAPNPEGRVPPPGAMEDPLILAELVNTHSLAERWHEFVATTLSSETAIQSTPLGGYGAQIGRDPLHAHRPGLADDSDDALGPPGSPRGILGGGDVIDMDDNDFDIAASMMAGLTLGRPTEVDETGSAESGSYDGSGDSDRSYNSGETASEKSGYVFDDPLGRAGGLGIELGKLTKYRPEESAGERFQSEEEDDGNDSSDEEPDVRRGDSDGDVPVMDLFAGNFNYNTQSSDLAETGGDWSNFANFESAETAFGDFQEATAVPPVGEETIAGKQVEIEEIFGTGDHASLLEEEEISATAVSSTQTDLEAPDDERAHHESVVQANDTDVNPAVDERNVELESAEIPSQTIPLEALPSEVIDLTGEPSIGDTSEAEIMSAPSDELCADLAQTALNIHEKSPQLHVNGGKEDV